LEEDKRRIELSIKNCFRRHFCRVKRFFNLNGNFKEIKGIKEFNFICDSFLETFLCKNFKVFFKKIIKGAQQHFGGNIIVNKFPDIAKALLCSC
jgi:hypothetical protein